MATQTTPATNQPVARLSEILARHENDDRWSEKLILDGRNGAALISSVAGTPGDPHLHPDFNEWWLGLGGQTSWQIGEYEPVIAEFGDIVFIDLLDGPNSIDGGNAVAAVKLKWGDYMNDWCPRSGNGSLIGTISVTTDGFAIDALLSKGRLAIKPPINQTGTL